ncbi:MAG TPA: hypothetical protein VNS58_26540 [Puia sp.]|nr:hypothetical protein [Puia sp.]
MKRIFMLLFLLPFLSRAQNSYTVSNIPGVTANFRTLQGAIDSVAASSTLYVFPSAIDYGNININKKILIVGTGFMLDQNAAPYTSPNQEGVVLSSVWFQPGSDNSYLEGLHFSGETTGLRYYRLLLDSVANVTVNRCMLEIWPSYPGGNIEIETKNTSNCTFSQCYITGLNLGFPNHSGGEQYIELGTGSQNLQFINNIFDNRSADAGMTFNHNVSPVNYGSVIFTNNVFAFDVNTTDFCNYTYFNNFFIAVNPGKAVYSNVHLNGTSGFNITNVPALFPVGSGNFQGANVDSLFVNSTFGYHSFDQRWQVLPSSFAKTFANDGGEVGAYGGYNPYMLSGITTYPNIYSVTVSRDTTIHGNALVRIKANATN